MANGDVVGSARVRIEADLSGLERSVQPGVQRAADQAEATLVAAFREAAGEAEAALANLSDAASALVVDADAQPLLDEVGTAEAAVDQLATETAEVPLDADPNELLQAVAASEAAVEDLATESATVPLDGDAGGVLRAVGQAEAAVDQLASESATVPIDGDASGLREELAGVRAEAETTTGSIEGMFAAVVGSPQRAATAGVAALGAAVGLTGAQFNILSQQATAALTATLGSRDAARDLIADVVELNQTAAFSRQAFIESTQQLVGFGVEAENVTGVLDAMQQAIVAVGGGEEEFAQLTNILAEVESQGAVTGETLQRLSELGINAVDLLSETTGESVDSIREAISAGEVGLEDITEALGTRYAGAVEGYANTWTGALGLVQAGLRNIGSALLEPFIGLEEGGAAVEGLTSIADVLNNLASSVVPPLAQALGSLASAVTPFIDAFVSGLGPALDGLGAVVGALPGPVLAMAGAFGAARVAGIGLSTVLNTLRAHPVVFALTGLTTVIGAIVGSTEDADAAMREYANTLDDVSGASTSATRELAAQRLEEEGLLQQAEALGVAKGDLVNAIVGEEGAYRRLQAQLGDVIDDNTRYVEGQMVGRQVTSGLGRDAQELVGHLEDERNALSTSAEEAQRVAETTQQAAESSVELAEATEQVEAALQPLTGALQPTVGGFVDLARALQDSEDAEADFAAAAERMGVDVEQLQEVVPAVTERFDSLVGSLRSNMPQAADAVSEALSRAEDAGSDFTLDVLADELDNTVANAEQFINDFESLVNAGFTRAAELGAEQGPQVMAALAAGLENPEQLERIETALGELSTLTNEEVVRAAETGAVMGEALAVSMLQTLRIHAPGIAEFFSVDIPGRVRGASGEIRSAGSDAGAAAATGFGAGITPAQLATQTLFNTGIPESIRRGAPAAGVAGGEVGTTAANNVVFGLEDGQPGVFRAAQGFVDDIGGRAPAAGVAGRRVGSSASNSVEEGIRGGRGGIFSAMNSLVGTIRGIASSADPTVDVGVVGPSDGEVSSVMARIRQVLPASFDIPVNTVTGDVRAPFLPRNSADGRIVDTPMLTWVGEAGHPEAIIPLDPSKGPRRWDLLQASGLADEVVAQLTAGHGDTAGGPDLAAALTRTVTVGGGVGAGALAEAREPRETNVTNNFNLNGHGDDEQMARRVARRVERSIVGTGL